MTDLFPAPFLAQLERLPGEFRRLRSTLGDGRRGRGGLEAFREFSGHAPYTHGTDPRHLDWAAYGRLDKLYLKQFSSERATHLIIVPDLSASMNYGEPPKWIAALRMAAAFAALALADHIEVTLLLHDRRHHFAGTQRLAAVLDVMRNARAEGNDFFAPLAKTIGTSRGTDNLVVITDLMETLEYAGALLAAIPGKSLSITGVLAPEEFAPSFVGPALIHGHEDTMPARLTLDAETQALYRTELDAHLSAWRDICARHRIGFHVCTSADDISELFLRALPAAGVI